MSQEILRLLPCLGGGGGDGGGGSVACGQSSSPRKPASRSRPFLLSFSLFVRLMKQVADLESEISSSRKHHSLRPIQMPTSRNGDCRCYGENSSSTVHTHVHTVTILLLSNSSWMKFGPALASCYPTRLLINRRCRPCSRPYAANGNLYICTAWHWI